MTVKHILRISSLLATAVMWSASSVAADRQNGGKIYDQHCVACHGEYGNTLDPTVPNFANGDRLIQMDSELLRQIRSGNQTMPSFRGILSDSEIRDVIAYLRTL